VEGKGEEKTGYENGTMEIRILGEKRYCGRYFTEAEIGKVTR